MAYTRLTSAESNGTIVLGINSQNLIPDFCIFYLPFFAESKRRFGIGVGGNIISTRTSLSGQCMYRQRTGNKFGTKLFNTK